MYAVADDAPDADVAMRVRPGGIGVGVKTRAVSSASSSMDDALYEDLISMLLNDASQFLVR